MVRSLGDRTFQLRFDGGNRLVESLFLDLQRYCAAEAADSAGLGARLQLLGTIVRHCEKLQFAIIEAHLLGDLLDQVAASEPLREGLCES